MTATTDEPVTGALDPIDRVARRIVRFVARHLRSAPSAGLGDTVRELDRRYDRAILVVRAYYALGLLWVVQSSSQWPGLRDTQAFAPLWPASWVPNDAPGTEITIILYAYLGAAIAGVCFPRSRLVRIAYSVALLQYLAISMGFGKINHNYHAWWWTSAVLVFLPTARRFRAGGRDVQHQTLTALWSAQVLVLFFYTLTGIWKVLYAVRALTTPAVSAFELDGFSLVLADRLLQTNQQTLMGEFLVDHALPGWLLFNGTMYLEATSLLIAFRPRLHRLWGVGLLLFHVGTQVAMGFTFVQNVALLGLLFLASPWAPEDNDVRSVVLDLPGIRLVHRLLQRRRVEGSAAAAVEG